jgi:hypothetical protein
MGNIPESIFGALLLDQLAESLVCAILSKQTWQKKTVTLILQSQILCTSVWSWPNAYKNNVKF